MARTCAITALIILRDFAQGSNLNVRLPRLDGKLSLCQFPSQVGCMVKPGDKTPFHGCIAIPGSPEAIREFGRSWLARVQAALEPEGSSTT